MATLDLHHDGATLVTLFKRTFPCLYDMIKRMCEAALGQPMGEGDWQHLVARITMEYDSAQLDRLDKEAKVILPRFIAQEDGPVNGKPDWLSDEFDQFGFFVANEL